MKIIEFDKHYKKLDCGIGNIFTSIRRNVPENEFKYIPSEIFNVVVNGKSVCKAKLLSTIHLHNLWYMDMNILPLLKYDTDNNINDLIKRYKNDEILLLIFQKVSE
ncbi:MAG: hypothetical protein QXU98_13310 [Candidatus Parvarchaeota archaeon]